MQLKTKTLNNFRQLYANNQFFNDKFDLVAFLLRTEHFGLNILTI